MEDFFIHKKSLKGHPKVYVLYLLSFKIIRSFGEKRNNGLFGLDKSYVWSSLFSRDFIIVGRKRDGVG